LLGGLAPWRFKIHHQGTKNAKMRFSRLRRERTSVLSVLSVVNLPAFLHSFLSPERIGLGSFRKT